MNHSLTRVMLACLFAAAATTIAHANIFTTASAYQDLNNQFDPGGRLGQVMFRLNW